MTNRIGEVALQISRADPVRGDAKGEKHTSRRVPLGRGGCNTPPAVPTMPQLYREFLFQRCRRQARSEARSRRVGTRKLHLLSPRPGASPSAARVISSMAIRSRRTISCSSCTTASDFFIKYACIRAFSRCGPTLPTVPAQLPSDGITDAAKRYGQLLLACRSNARNE